MNTNKVIEYSGQLAVLITETIQENSEFDIEDINENITEFITALSMIKNRLIKINQHGIKLK